MFLYIFQVWHSSVSVSISIPNSAEVW